MKKNKIILSAIERFSIKNFFFLLIAGIINSIGVTMFLTPVNLYDSGISGTSMSQITLSICLVILNIPLFLFGLKKRGATKIKATGG